MTEIGVASSVLALAQFTFQSSVLLYEKVESFQDAPKKVRDLRDELESLTETLSQTTQNSQINLDSLALPLRTCDKLCKGFLEFIDHNTTYSSDGKISKRDWVKLEYRGNDITEFKNKLASYRSTISVALGDANLRTKHVTHRVLVAFRTTSNDAVKDLKEQQETILEKLADRSLNDAVERTALEEEKASIVAALEITQKALEHAQPANVNIVEDNESSSTAIQAISATGNYLIHAKSNKATDKSTQFIGNVDGATVQKAIQARLDAQLRGRGECEAVGQNTKEVVQSSTRFRDQYGTGQKLI